MIKYFIYARKSSEGDDRQITSINDQVEECLKIAKRNNLQVVDVISESKSAKSPGRKGFNDMIQRIQNGEANGVITWKLNRIARNSLDGGNFIWQLQQGIIRHVQTISQGFYPKDNLVVMHIEFGMASQYSTDLGISVRRGILKKNSRGWYSSPILPIGYVHNTKKEIAKGAPEIIKDSKQFDNIKILWKKLLEHKYQVQELKPFGDALGIKSVKGNNLSRSAYYRLFRNEFYCGFFYWNNEEGEKVKIQGKHIPMITPLEFRKAQNILNKRTAIRTNNTGDSHRQYVGVFKCGECNSAFTPSVVNRAYCKHCKCKFSIHSKKECPRCKVSISHKEQFSFLYKVYYHCTKKRQKCSQPHILKSELEQQIIKFLKSLTIDTKIYNWCIQYLEKYEQKDTSKNKEQHLKQRISQFGKKLQGYTDMRAENELTKQEYQDYSTPIKKQIEVLKDELEKIEYEAVNWKKELEKGLNFAHNLAETFKKGDVFIKRKILLEIGANPIILDKRTYFITPKHLNAVKNIVVSSQAQNQWNKPKKSLVEQGDFCGISLPISICGENETRNKQYKKPY